MGAMEGSVLVAYDLYSKAVHFMAVTSDDGVHDHRCAWKTDTRLECEPLKGGGMGGAEVTEDLAFTFDGKAGTFRSTITMKDGSKAVFEAAGKRR